MAFPLLERAAIARPWMRRGVAGHAPVRCRSDASHGTPAARWRQCLRDRSKDHDRGELKFSFTDCNHGRVDFTSSTPGYGEGHMDLARLTLPAGLRCP
ncbi:MAG TPA: hypothetical protein VHE32_10915 [Rhodanobacteraceae bacterium]|nr:hypothetical protein [Rhodanobacteraceae bacterium]